MIQCTIKELFDAWAPLLKYSRKDLAPKYNFRLAKLRKALQPHMDAYDEAYKKLITSVGGDYNEFTAQVAFSTKELTQKYMAELKALHAEALEIQVDPVDLSDLKDLSGTAEDRIFLEKFVKLAEPE